MVACINIWYTNITIYNSIYRRFIGLFVGMHISCLIVIYSRFIFSYIRMQYSFVFSVTCKMI